MGKGRLEAFSDGVIAIIITIMVLELRPPHGLALADLRPLAPVLASYALSFVYLGIYWNNHHHMLQAARTVSGGVLWANLHLLFWLSLIPFTTAWLGEHPLAHGPVGLYGLNMMMCAIAYTLLSTMLIRHEGPDSPLARAIGGDFKGWLSFALWVASIAASPFAPAISIALFILVAAIWFIPDRRIERVLGS
jgi:uncharacterized membrane protein